jgi:hypothetical protein
LIRKPATSGQKLTRRFSNCYCVARELSLAGGNALVTGQGADDDFLALGAEAKRLSVKKANVWAITRVGNKAGNQAGPVGANRPASCRVRQFLRWFGIGLYVIFE